MTVKLNVAGSPSRVIVSATEPTQARPNDIWIDTSDNSVPIAVLDTDGALTSNSDLKVPSQQAVKEYADVYKPRARQCFFPTCLYDSGDVEKPIYISGSYGHQQYTPYDGDYMLNPVFCVGGETKLDISYYKSTSRGIFDLYINGVLDSSGYDAYASSSAGSVITVTLTQPLVAGWNEVKFKANGKNASSSAYYISIMGVRVR